MLHPLRHCEIVQPTGKAQGIETGRAQDRAIMAQKIAECIDQGRAFGAQPQEIPVFQPVERLFKVQPDAKRPATARSTDLE